MIIKKNLSKNLFIIVGVLVFASTFFVSGTFVQDLSAQTAYVAMNPSVLAAMKTPAGKANSQSIVAYLKDPGTGWIKEMFITRKGKLNFKDVPRGSYLLEIYWEGDLLNPSISPYPIYTRNVSLGNADLDLGNISLPGKSKCPKDQKFYYNSNGGTCGAPVLRQGEYSAVDLENQVMAYLNFFRKKNNLPALETNDNLKEFLGSHVNEMAVNNYFSLNGLDGCDTTCRFNKFQGLTSIPYLQISAFYTYDKIVKQTGVPARYLSDYKVAKKIYNKIYKNKTKHYSAFNVSIVVRNNKVYMEAGGLPEYTSAEESEIRSLVNGLVAGKADDFAKAEAIHDWITSNIAYDPKKTFKSHFGPYAWRNRMAVCSGYAELYKYMMNMAGIDAPIVSGWAKNRHAWNRVNISGIDYYVDTTWDAGYVKRRKFFFNPVDTYMMIPETCIAVDHYPTKKEAIKRKGEYVRQNLDYFEEHCPELMSKFNIN